MTYPVRRNVHPVAGRARKDWKDDPGGQGTELVRTLRVCADCAEVPR